MNSTWFIEPWWVYGETDGAIISEIYHWFNISEGCIWLICSMFVFVRYIKYRNSFMEVFYATAFITFAISDFIEAQQMSFWLAAAKSANLIILIYLRYTLHTRYYPTAKSI